jgi:hypothetical protein
MLQKIFSNKQAGFDLIQEQFSESWEAADFGTLGIAGL